MNLLYTLNHKTLYQPENLILRPGSKLQFRIDAHDIWDPELRRFSHKLSIVSFRRQKLRHSYLIFKPLREKRTGYVHI